LAKHGFRSHHTDEGGTDWRSPQNFFVISEKQKAVPDQLLSAPGEADRVLQALLDYRREWRQRLAPKWYARSLARGTRRLAARLGRPIKRRLMGLGGE
jgi:hypothetical protein